MPSLASCASNTGGGDELAIGAAAHRPKHTRHTAKNNAIRMAASICDGGHFGMRRFYVAWQLPLSASTLYAWRFLLIAKAMRSSFLAMMQ